ncbi:carbonic anhydrase 12-like [Eucyclogobius newberryi]|uniref:carbonic anhydrase 12-like n=1 Tax=Eucyclogobius newberryi TaxID=166745 RepID=UPI003B5A91F7
MQLQRGFTSVMLLSTASLQHAWTYSGPEGEQHWSEHFPYCGGAFQSPIHIRSDLFRFDPSLGPIVLKNYNLSPNEQLTLGNNGHSVQISLPLRMHISNLPHHFSAAQVHFHWGSASRPLGSEHMVNNKQYAGEMHVVHFNSDKYQNLSVAADKSDGLAVLGVFIEIGEFNPAFDQFLKFLKGIKYKGQKVQISGFNVKDLFPARLDEYYRYDGSLTTPPCYPSVLWTVFRNPVTISRSQFESLATSLFMSHAQDLNPLPMNGNFRTTQLVDSRVVLVSFKEGRGLQAPLITPRFMREHIVQKLMVGDLADLADADEGLHQLLASVSKPPGANWKELQAQKGPKAKKHMLNSSQWKSQSRSVGKRRPKQNALCYVSLEHQVVSRLHQAHAENRLVQALEDEVFPELNLWSYLECRSDLALLTIRQILSERPTDEAWELDQSLNKALSGQKKTSAAGKKRKHVMNNGKHAPTIIPRKPPSEGHPHPWLQPMEWED